MQVISYTDARNSLKAVIDKVIADQAPTLIRRREGATPCFFLKQRLQTCRDPLVGVGKPEPLVGNLAVFWSRRIDDTHRLVYEADDASVVIVAYRCHYDD